MGNKKGEILKESLIFSNLSNEELEELSSITTEIVFKSGDYVFWEGDSPEQFYIVAEGRIKVHKISSLGKEMIMAFFGPGEIFGEIAVFQDKPYPASAQAMQDARVLAIRKSDFLNFIGAHARIALKIINILGGRLRDAQDRLRDLAGERVEQRIARTLLMLASKLGDSLPFTRQEIADTAGTTTETAIRVLSRLKEGGIIESTRGSIKVLNKTKLRLLAEGPPRI
ncbi:Crp/Fnr family transcriptional regulator [Chloroflexota bacterium]